MDCGCSIVFPNLAPIVSNPVSTNHSKNACLQKFLKLKRGLVSIQKISLRFRGTCKVSSSCFDGRQGLNEDNIL